MATVPSERVDVLIVGAGPMAWWHARAARRVGGAVRGVVDPDAARAALLAKRCRGATAFSDTEAALRALAPTVVHICTPVETHAGLARAALDAKCHVIAEKPLASNAVDTEELLARAAGVGRLLIPVHQFPFQRGARTLLERMSSLGRIVHFTAGAATAGASWPGSPAPDVVVAGILPHFLSLTHRLLEVSVAELPWSISRPAAGDWRAVTVCGETSVAYFLSTRARPTFAELHVIGELGSARVDLFHGYVVFEPGRVSRAAKIARPFRLAYGTLFAAAANLVRRVLSREPAYPGLEELISRAYAAVRGDSENPVPPAETRDVARARDRIISLSEDARPDTSG